MRTSRKATIAIVTAIAALAIATMASAASPGPDEPVQSTPGAPTGPIDPGAPQAVTPRPGMVNVHPTGFDSATIGDDGRTLTIDFWSGVEPCYVLDHVDVSYADDAVTVTLFQGSDPNAGDVACIEIAVLKQVTITLDQPLAGRTIVDGAQR